MPGYFEFVPTPKQSIFLKNPSKYKLFGGSMGAGKSCVLCAEAIRLSLLYPNNRGFICRHEFKSFKQSTMVELREMLPNELVDTWNKTDGEIYLKNGSLIMMGGLENPEKIKSMNLGWFAIDEATQTTKQIFHMLCSRLRLKHIPTNRLFGLLASNPEPGWVKDTFVDPELAKTPLYNHAFIQSLPMDNPHLPEGYIEELRNTLPPMWVKKYIEGSWDVHESQIFKPDYIIPTLGTPKFVEFFMAVDPAITETDDEKLDETAICIVGIDENNIIHEVETRHGRWSFETIINHCSSLFSYYNPSFFGVEKVGFQVALQQELNRRNIPAIPLKTDGDKTRRGYAIQSYFENGLVRVNNKELIKQLLEFPESAKHGGHDDLADAFIHCLTMVRNYSSPIISKELDKVDLLTPLEKKFWKGYKDSINPKEEGVVDFIFR